MSSIFGGSPSTPKPLPPPPDPNAAAEVARRMQEAAALERKARGRASTILTGGQGLLDEENRPGRILFGN